MELLKVWAALLRRKWLFLQAVVFFTVGAGILSFILPKQYEATSKISIESSDASLSILSDMDLGEMASSIVGASDDTETKIALAEMRPMLDEVIWRLQLRDSDGELLPAEKLLVPGIDGDILAYPSIEIETQQGTEILVVLATSNNPELSALLADTMVEVYLTKSQEAAKKDTQDALTFVTGELGRLRGEFDTALKTVADAKAREKVIDLDSEVRAAVGRVSELYAAREEADAEIADVRAQIRQHGVANLDETFDLVSPATQSTNPLVRELKKDFSDLQQTRAKELLDKTPKHPDIVLLDAEIRDIELQLTEALREQHELDPDITGLQVQLAGLVQRREQIDGAAAATIEEFAIYPDKMREIAGFQLAADATEAIYKSLLETQYEIAVAEAMTVSDMRAVEPAKAPDKASAPKLIVYVILGFFVGNALGIGLVFLAEYIDESVKGTDDVKEVWPLALLGIVPHYRLKDKRGLIDALPATDPLYEAFRNIRNGVSFAGVDQQINILTVTSCVPGEGKSTVMANLAICLAQDGQRVIIVDCDMRRPVQHRMFPALSNERGLSSVLTNACSAEDAIQRTPVENLNVLTSGPIPSNPGRLVESLRLRQLLHQLAGQYDMVLVDAPPLLVVGDGAALFRSSKGMVIVVEAGKTTRRMLSDLRQRAETAGIEPTGIVLNKVDVRAGQHHYYGYYARHYKSDEKPGKKGKVA
ncbi:chain-length determining protein [Deltaproteobacteria bacterium]|nr:chain-length determining protein [Deltaproteobacteria bacterium]